jgi:hypothetical protein
LKYELIYGILKGLMKFKIRKGQTVLSLNSPEATAAVALRPATVAWAGLASPAHGQPWPDRPMRHSACLGRSPRPKRLRRLAVEGWLQWCEADGVSTSGEGQSCWARWWWLWCKVGAGRREVAVLSSAAAAADEEATRCPLARSGSFTELFCSSK